MGETWGCVPHKSMKRRACVLRGRGGNAEWIVFIRSSIYIYIHTWHFFFNGCCWSPGGSRVLMQMEHRLVWKQEATYPRAEYESSRKGSNLLCCSLFWFIVCRTAALGAVFQLCVSSGVLVAQFTCIFFSLTLVICCGALFLWFSLLLFFFFFVEF